jgi:WD40 repeat protein
VRGHFVTGVAFSTDGRLLATANGREGTVTVWDAVTGGEVRTLRGQAWQARCVVFSADGKTLASGSGHPDDHPAPGVIELWEVSTGKCLHTLRGHDGTINSLAFGTHNGVLASGSDDKTVRLWDPTVGRQLASFTGHTGPVRSVAFSPDGKLLASGGDTTVQVSAVTLPVHRILWGHTAEVVSVAFSPDGQRLVSVDDQNNVKVWDARANPEAHPIGGAIAAAFSRDCRHLFLAAQTGVFHYDPTTGRRQWLEWDSPPPHFGEKALSLSVSPDGRRLAAGGLPGTWSWDLTTGSEIPQSLAGKRASRLPGGGPRGMFSPDGRRLARTAGLEIKVCDADTGRELLDLRGHTAGRPKEREDGSAAAGPRPFPGVIQGVSFSADGKTLASIADREVKVWDLDSGQAIRTLSGPDVTYPSGFEVPTSPDVALSPDGRLVAASGDDVKVWEVSTGRELHTLRGHTRLIPLLAFSPNGRRLVSGSRDGSVILWDVVTGQETFRFHPGGTICCLTFSPDGRRLLAASRPGAFEVSFLGGVTIWDAHETRPEVEATSQEAQKADRRLREAEQALLARRGDHSAAEWLHLDLEEWLTREGKDCPRFRDEIPVQPDPPRLLLVRSLAWSGAHVYHTCFSPDGRSYLAGGDVGPLRLWDVETGRQLQEFKGHDGWTAQAAFTPDGKQVLSGGAQDRCLRLWDVTTGGQVRVFTGHTDAVLSVAVSPDGRLALSGSADKTLRLWELATGKEVRRLEGHAGGCWGIFSADGRHVLSFSDDKTLRLWEADTGKLVRTLAGHTGPVAGAWFLPGGKQVVSYAADNTLRVWDVEGGKEVRRLALGADHCAIRWLALTPDGRGFLTNHQDYTVRWHDLATGREWHRVTVPGASPQGLSVSPDGRHAAGGSFRGFVSLFRLAGGGEVQPEKPEKKAEPTPGR